MSIVGHLEWIENEHDIKVTADQKINLEHLKTMYDGDLSDVQVVLDFPDPRLASPRQRHLFFALRSDICNSTYNSPADVKKELYDRYFDKYGKEISLSNEAQASMTEVNNLLAITIDFCFEYDVEFKKGYELLPRNESYYLYLCCKWRRCMICGVKNSQIAHYEAVGNRSRKKVDHRKLPLMCLCGAKHHPEQHKIGLTTFCEKYHIQPIKLSEDALIKLHIMTRKRMNEIDEEAQHETIKSSGS